MATRRNRLSRIEGGAKRLAEIAAVFAKYGLADWLNNTDYDWVQRRLRSDGGENLTHRSTDERIRLALTELGTSAVKLGQILSTRPDIIGPRLVAELSRLQANTPPEPVEDVIATIQVELGAPLGDLFSSFDQTPLASASIGQVHRAVLPGGELVVVKVMHRGIEQTVERDLDLLAFLAGLAQKHAPALKPYQPLATAKLFRRTLLRELDFEYERRYLQEFQANFRDDPTVRFPRVFPALCSRRVVTMEFLDGIPVSDRDRLGASGEDLNELARRGANLYLEMIFRDGFYHADPHAGNLLILPGNRVGVLDCGMVGRIDERLRDEIEAMLLAAVAPDPADLTEIVCRVGAIPPELDRDALCSELSDLLADFSNQSLDRFDLGGALNRMLELIQSYHIVLPQGFALLLKTLVMLEGTAKFLSPSFSLAELLEPYYKRALARRFAPRRFAQDMMRSFRDWRRLFDALPRDLSDIVSRIRSGRFEIHMEHRRLESSVDRLVQGLLTSALFVGSSMLLASAVPPTVRGVSLAGAAGCCLALSLGARLLLAIRGSGRRRTP